VGGTLTAAETVMNAQKDMTLLNEARLKTSININDIEQVSNTSLNFSITNNGDETVTDLSHMDVFSFDSTNGYVHYTYSSGSGIADTWQILRFENAHIHAKELDPGVKMWIQVNLPAGVAPRIIQVTTNNGVSAVSAI
jgi:archaellum component FlaF (FlaF/FlaG flagellin family)